MALWNCRQTNATSRWPTPGIFVNVEFGVSFSLVDTPHMASMKYTSDNMRESMRRQHQEARDAQPHNSIPVWQQSRLERQQRQQRQQQYRDPQRQQHRDHPQRSRRLGIETPSPRERGRSAPPPETPKPTLVAPEIMSPVSPLSPYGSFVVNRAQTLPATAALFSDRPLPPLPSRFRLGEDEMPWSTDPWYRYDVSDENDSVIMGRQLEQSRSQRRTEDPQRRRELEDLHLAMMTVDSLDQEGWQRWSWDSVQDSPRPTQRAPECLGWAVSRTEEVPDLYADDYLDRIIHAEHEPPPPYVVSQYESSSQAISRRPRSAYT